MKEPAKQSVIQQMKHMQVALSIIGDDKLIIADKDLEHPLGRGGFGTVYKGTWQGISVAIKRLHLTEMTKEMLSEFRSEAKIMASLNHLNTLRLYGVCVDRGRYSLVTPLMTKGSLFQLLHNKQALPWRLRYQLSRDIACGLSYLHSRNILHRDLKSLNVLLDDRLRGKLCDFGLSRLRQETLSNASATASNQDQAVGTLAWMAPELFQRRTKYSKHADIYSFGMVLWEIASRAVPFADAQNQAVLMHWVEKGEQEEIPEKTPEGFAKLITKCWNKTPSERYSADKIVRVLDGILSRMTKPSVHSSVPAYRHFTDTHIQHARPANVSGPVYKGNLDTVAPS